MPSKMIVKHIASRNLKNGKAVIIASDSIPLVVDREIADSLIKNPMFLNNCNPDVRSLFEESGYFRKFDEEANILPIEQTTTRWNFYRKLSLLVGILSLIIIIFALPFTGGIPTGNKILAQNVHFFYTFLFVIFVSVLSSLLHEYMHIFFSNSAKRSKDIIKIRFIKSTATVSMSHIWVWSLFPRFIALSAGLISDLFLLAIVTVTQVFIANWILIVTSAVLWVRILWQFRFHKKCDGQLIFQTLLDNPLFGDMTALTDNSLEQRKEKRLMRILKFIGYTINILLLIFWCLPFFLSIYRYFAN
ncbi:hypothetical protein [Niallia sp. FSL R7-0271]|uniref:hypothetical protein n=1 Tax=unclassified Niallia TaxID=2837522 RepID=UPI0030FCB531